MYIPLYTTGMRVTITEFRKDLFTLVERVIAGDTVEFTHHGTTIRLVVPEARSSRLDRLTPRQITNPELPDEAELRLQAEMWAEIEKDWTELN
jgi:antitoxin (DNA-binding transcriptional repressor) of toxin-antitoxin stability system